MFLVGVQSGLFQSNKKDMEQMEKKTIRPSRFKVTAFIFLCILMLIVISMGIFAFSSKDKTKIVETKTFSEIPGFSFEYPVFKSYETVIVNKIGDAEYQIVSSALEQKDKMFNEVVFINIRVKKEDNSNYGHIVPGKVATINPNKVEYYPIGGYESLQSDNLVFFSADRKYVVLIKPELQGLSIDIKNGGLSKPLADKIIETFMFEKNTKKDAEG